ncbi:MULTISPECIES: O-antigen ligase family protein [unclassified Roseitalea]|uniref:O-antigen ligase family protein n=1 Tax=unclassified Roseitalea TaxID=2639107 RepID=UPI00273FD03C|nr:MULTISPECIES: O-antigen ligase family protein [unclassified Roseitalea]
MTGPAEPRDGPSTYWAALVVLVAMLIGGGTTNGLFSDRIIQIALLPLIVIGALRIRAAQLPSYAAAWLLALAIVLAWQLFPLAWWPGGAAHGFVSASPGKALDYAIFALTLSGFAVYVTTLTEVGQRRILLVFILGYFINLTMAAVQLSFVGNQGPFSSPFYPFAQGAFQNQNHFSSLIYALVPVFAFLLIHERRQIAAYITIVAIAVLVLLAANARAAIAISVGLSIVSLVVFSNRGAGLARGRVATLLGASALALVIVAVVFGRFVGEFGEDLRVKFNANTMTAIVDFLPLGSGLGSFVDIYPRYEPQTGIERVYANHAHNDYLELILELGLPGLALIVGLIAIIAANLLISARSLAFGMGALAILAHSIVDYPLRTYAIGLVFAFFCAVVMTEARAKPARIR